MSCNYMVIHWIGGANGQFQCLAKFLLKHEKQNPSLWLKRSYQKIVKVPNLVAKC